MDYEEYTPTETQMPAHLSPCRFKLYGGAMGGGKSVWLCAEAIRLSIMFPKNTGLLARFRFKDFKKTTLPILMEMIPQKIIKNHNKSDGLIELKNGSKIYTSDLEDPNKLKSLNLGFFGIDEATDVPNVNIFNMLKTRLRLNIPKIRYFGLLATNPEPGWVKDLFIVQNLADHQYFPATPYDNPHLPKDYIDGLIRDLPPVWREKYINGSWDVFDAQIFKPNWISPSETLSGLDIAFKVIAVDPAITEKNLVDKNNDPDETAIITLGVERGTNLVHELETVSGCWNFNDVVENIKSAYNRHKPDLLGIETVAFQKGLADVLSKEGVNVISLKPDADKVRRAIVVQDMFERGRVRVNSQKLQRQLLEFPKGTHDDLVDAIVYGLRMIRDHSAENFEKINDKYKHLDGASTIFWKSHFGELNESDNTRAFEGFI